MLLLGDSGGPLSRFLQGIYLIRSGCEKEHPRLEYRIDLREKRAASVKVEKRQWQQFTEVMRTELECWQRGKKAKRRVKMMEEIYAPRRMIHFANSPSW